MLQLCKEPTHDPATMPATCFIDTVPIGHHRPSYGFQPDNVDDDKDSISAAKLTGKRPREANDDSDPYTIFSDYSETIIERPHKRARVQQASTAAAGYLPKKVKARRRGEERYHVTSEHGCHARNEEVWPFA